MRPSFKTFQLNLVTVLVACLSTAAVPAAEFANTGAMHDAREFFAQTLLPDGTVLVEGGASSPTSQNITGAEIYNPQFGSWQTTGSLNVGRGMHTATLLANGQVLVVGGGNTTSNAALNSVELYDPTSTTWTRAATMVYPRDGHTATLLADGRVLVAGGNDSSGINKLNSMEIYNPNTGTWLSTNVMLIARSFHTATLLPSGKVLIAGGSPYGNGSTSLAQAELFDPVTRTNTTIGAGQMNSTRAEFTATLLPSGVVLVVGGYSTGLIPQATAELYYPTNGTWILTSGTMHEARAGHTATLLPDGTVLIAGGKNASGILTSSEIYNPATDMFTTNAAMNVARAFGNSTLLPNGQVLVAGGVNSTVGYVAGTELWNSAPAPMGALTVTLDPPDAIVAGAQWAVDDSDYLNSGAVVTGLAAGSHIVYFRPLAGWVTPVFQNGAVTVGATNTLTANYVKQTSGVPNLSILSVMPNAIVVLWPNTGTYTLQTNNNIATTNWVGYGGNIFMSSGTNYAIFTPPTENLYFRLSSFSSP
jgi:hypothetical protein